MTLLQKTKEIVENSITSALFIDEKALEGYDKRPRILIPEQELSINLCKNFKKKGINLSVHKFKITDLDNIPLLDYFFTKRDLVLLDWKLNGNDGEEYSLKLLSKIVEQKNIHFCSIYTSEDNFDEIINNIVTFFSGYSKEYYNNIIETLEIYRDASPEVFNRISFENKHLNARLFNDFRNIDQNLPQIIKNVTDLSDFGEALIQVCYAFSNFEKSDFENPKPTNINRENYTLNIKNTIVTIIPKSENSASKIISKLQHQVYKSENCFIQLLGLDMQNSFSKNSSFIDENLLQTKVEALMFHRKQLNDNGLNSEFNNFIKTLLLRHSKQTLENSTLQILDDVFLDRITKSKYSIIPEELAQLNTFYNGTFISGKRNLNFGDIFRKEGTNEYYLCITALCDCLHPANIKNNFFFVKGIPTDDLHSIINSGDGGFKSYIDGNTCIVWTAGEYVKPFQLHIFDPLISNNILNSSIVLNNVLSPFNLEYVFSLKSSYAQRIANHTFTHPTRVGVDFVKIK
ncbi:MAG: response regulator receiver domain [Myroides sp.]